MIHLFESNYTSHAEYLHNVEIVFIGFLLFCYKIIHFKWHQFLIPNPVFIGIKKKQYCKNELLQLVTEIWGNLNAVNKH